MLGIIIGIAAIIAIVSTIEGTNELIKQNMMGNNRHTVKVQLSQDDYTYEISTWNPSPEGVPLLMRIRVRRFCKFKRAACCILSGAFRV